MYYVYYNKRNFPFFLFARTKKIFLARSPLSTFTSFFPLKLFHSIQLFYFFSFFLNFNCFALYACVYLYSSLLMSCDYYSFSFFFFIIFNSLSFLCTFASSTIYIHLKMIFIHFFKLFGICFVSKHFYSLFLYISH